MPVKKNFTKKNSWNSFQEFFLVKVLSLNLEVGRLSKYTSTSLDPYRSR
jgi:hypothetical protein